MTNSLDEHLKINDHEDDEEDDNIMQLIKWLGLMPSSKEIVISEVIRKLKLCVCLRSLPSF